MAKKSKGILIVEKLDKYILENFKKISHLELNQGISNILKEYRKFKGINPAIIMILTIFRYKDIEFFKKFKTTIEIEKYFQNILTNYCITAQIAVVQLPAEIIEKIREYYYKVNPEVEKFDKMLIFYHRNKYLADDEDIKTLLDLKEQQIKRTIEENNNIINKSVFIREFLKKQNKEEQNE